MATWWRFATSTGTFASRPGPRLAARPRSSRTIGDCSIAATWTGSEGRIFVNRGTLDGKPVESLVGEPVPRGRFNLYGRDNLDRPPREGKLDAIGNHMGNFFDCVASRQQPISDVWSQYRGASTCHLGNIAMRVGRPLDWDPEKDEFPGDEEANRLLSREPRAGYEVV